MTAVLSLVIFTDWSKTQKGGGMYSVVHANPTPVTFSNSFNKC